LPDGAQWEGSVRLSVQGAGRSREVEVTPGDETVVEDVPPGEWRLVARSRATQGDRKLAIASLTFGLQDTLVAPITIAESGNPVLEVTLTAATGGIAGVFEGDLRNKPEIVLARRQGMPTLDIALVSRDGSFRFTDLAPGTYEVITPGTNGQFPVSPESRPVKVEVRTGQTSSVKLTVP
jgi:hypothetical protein